MSLYRIIELFAEVASASSQGKLEGQEGSVLGMPSPSSQAANMNNNIPQGYIPSPETRHLGVGGGDHHDTVGHGHGHLLGGSGPPPHMDSADVFSSVGLALVLGFIFMLLVDQCSRSRPSSRDLESSSSYPAKRSFTATLGLVVHAAGTLNMGVLLKS
jgi:hypothetical protein